MSLGIMMRAPCAQVVGRKSVRLCGHTACTYVIIKLLYIYNYKALCTYYALQAQVVGRKYVRLYGPEETPRLYPCPGPDFNSSRVDGPARPGLNGTERNGTACARVPGLRARARAFV